MPVKKKCCSDSDCHELSHDYKKSISETIIHLLDNPFICDKQKRHIGKFFGRQLLIMSSVYGDKELGKNEIEMLEKASIMLVPHEIGEKITKVLESLSGISSNTTEK